MSRKGWLAEEHVLAGPVADLLRKACAEEREFVKRSHGFVSRGRLGQELPSMGGDSAAQIVTSRNEYERRYAERFEVTHRTAIRHFSLVLSQPTIPVVIADRIAALLGVPLAYLEAVS